MSSPPLPAVPQFYLDGEPHLEPGRITQYACERQGITIEQLGVRPVIIGTFFPEIGALLAQQAGAQKSEHRLVGEREFYVADDLSIVAFQMGAPGTVMTAEELIACGAEKLIILGAAGSLQPDLPVASVVLPTTAIREEGTSHHYAPPEIPAVASPVLLAALRAACVERDLEPREGLHWTTDAPMREHTSKIELYREAGVLSVDMEVSALYVLAQHRGIECAAVLAISDELYEPYRIGYDTPEFANAFLRCAAATVAAAKAAAETNAG
jgi:uridine phosphorylase